MNKNTAIKVQNLTKTYKLYDKPIDRLKESLHPLKKKYHKDFYALNDVSFEIKKGETVGIIGKNGSGKSTLLKIITGVLSSSIGKVNVNGKISAILELGSGFNPELTGLENIYLNTSINGIKKDDIEKKIDEIVDFSELKEFINQPIKTYSSGMKARLAFAVSISIEPQILIIDEALSVGDARFQAKCMRKMDDISKKGVTILFVSHDIQSIKKFCKYVIWLDKGQIVKQGSPEKILKDYISYMNYNYESSNESITSISDKKVKNEYPLINVQNCESFGEKKAFIEGILFMYEGKPSKYLIQGTKVSIICEFYTYIDLHDVALGILFKNKMNLEILTFNSYMYDCSLHKVEKNSRMRVIIDFIVPKIKPNEYIITVALSEGTQKNHIQQHWIHEATTVNVISSDNIDAYILTLYPKEIKYKYEQI